MHAASSARQAMLLLTSSRQALLSPISRLQQPLLRQPARALRTSSNQTPITRLARTPGRFSIRQFFLRQQRRLLSDSKPPTNASASASNAATAAAAADTSLSGRLKKLSREYGWTAVGVYFALSALDFPFCFIAVRLLGTERIGRWEHQIVEYVKRAIPFQWPERFGGQARLTKVKEPVEGEEDQLMGYDHGVKAAQEQNAGDSATIWTQLALAYAIHKSFIFIRVPLTAAILPKVVKTLRGWGWNIGKRTPKKTTGVPSNS